jgi:aminopeptidase N
MYESYLEALELDGLASSHPIQCTVGHPRECSQVFDQISYAKGGSVIRMLFHWMGEENFRKGTTAYLKKHAYQSCKTEQLWEAFEDTINSPDYPVLSVGKQWTALKHFPIIKLVW